MENIIQNNSQPVNAGDRDRLPFVIIAILSITVLVLIMMLLLFRDNKNLSVNIDDRILEKNENVAKISASIVKHKMDSLLVLGSTYASNKKVINLVKNEKWGEALFSMAGVFQDIPYVNQLFLLDLTGNVLASMPEKKDLTGWSYTRKDWYKEVTSGKPYLSEMYENTGESARKVSALILPIRDEKNELIGILVLEVQADYFSDWLRNIEFGKSGGVFIIDQKGQVIIYSNINLQGLIINHTLDPYIQKVIAGKSGTEIILSQKDKQIVSSYEPINNYNWGVISVISLNEIVENGLANIRKRTNYSPLDILIRRIRNIICSYATYLNKFISLSDRCID
jgi:methyl-accepting chemotaxis protein